MKLKNNNFMMMLAAFLIIAMAVMAYVLYAQDKSLDKSTVMLNSQSSSDETDAIESDVKGTDLSSLDSELTDIEKEINSTE